MAAVWAWTAAVEDRLMTEWQVELVALANQKVANRRVCQDALPTSSEWLPGVAAKNVAAPAPRAAPVPQSGTRGR